MKINKKFIMFAISFVVMISLFPIVNAKAASSDLKILSDSQVTAAQAKNWAKSKGSTETFASLADLYFKYYTEHGNVNPAIAYVQAAKETGYGKFGGVLDDSFHNPCGLKIAAGGSDTDPNAHKRFNSWDDGVQAHLDHLALYAGADGYPRSSTNDERHFRTIKGTAPTIDLLGGKWAPSPTYGDEVYKLYNDLLSYSGIKSADSAGDKNNAINNPGPGNPNTINNDPSIPDPVTSETKPNSPSIGTVIEESNANIDKNKSNADSKTFGWKSESGKWYYFGNPGVMSKGWIHPSNWYFMQGDGSMVTGLKSIGNKTYFFNNNGSMITGWQQIDNNWYYFNTDGSMVTGWISDGRNYYYLYDTGAMAKGWINLNGAWYYLNDTGAMAVGWIKYNSYWYYLDVSTGKMTKKSKMSGNNDKTITIDAGHDYGSHSDGGTVVTTDGVTYSESDLDIQVAAKLEKELEKRGYKVVMTRNEGERPDYGSLYDSLSHRADTANNSNSSLFISIHHNAVDGIPEAKGVETYYSAKPKDAEYGGGLDSDRLEKSRQMAKAINDNIASKIGANNRGAKSDASAAVGSLFVLRNTKMPAVLVEVGFMTNSEEAVRCGSQEGQQKVAEAIAEAVSANLT